ncbi:MULTISPECIES: hypothetical protein [unclassified Microbacterium]|uniref:hypothetical protein n=1 Tax=unclassified Microbacterium TaxID=2609290 RepID=UPI00301AD382
MRSKNARAVLSQAMEATALVRVERTPKWADHVEGFVLRVGPKWALMARTVDGGYFDGVIAFRLRHVKRITDDESVAVRFSRTRPEWPPAFDPDVDLATTAGVLGGMGWSGALLGIQKERERSATWIGTLDQIHGRFVYLHEVRPDGAWHAAPLGYRLRAITSVEVGRRYYAALFAIAGDVPPHERPTLGTTSR